MIMGNEHNELKRIQKQMAEKLLEAEEAAAVMFTFADQVDAMNEALSTERAEGEKTGEIKMLMKLLEKGRISVEDAAAEAGMTVNKFRETYLMPVMV